MAQPLWTIDDALGQWSCALRDLGIYGFEVTISLDGSGMISVRFERRADAVVWAERERLDRVTAIGVIMRSLPPFAGLAQ